MNTNKTIHEAMGLCWHEAGKPTTLGRNYGCVKCGSGFVVCSVAYPDYTDPVHYCALMDWMRGDWLRWYKFKDWLDSGFPQFLNKPVQEQITLIAEAIEAGVLK